MTDLPGLIPVSVTLVFPKILDSAPVRAPYTKTVTLASLALSDFTGVETNTGSKTLLSSCTAVFTTAGGGTPTNNTELNALANKIATDWYRWQLSTATIAYAGSCPWIISGMEDAVEWTWETPEPHTRILRPPFNDFGVPMLQYGTGGSVTNYVYNIVVENITITNTLNIYNTTVNVNQYTIWYDYSVHIVNNYYVWNDPAPVSVVTDVCPINKTVSKTVTGTTTINSGTLTDLTGSSSTFTLLTAADCQIVAKFEWDGNGAATTTETFGGYVIVDTVAQTEFTKTYIWHASQIVDGVVVLKLSLAAGSHTIKLQAKRLTGAGSVVLGVNTTWCLQADTKVNVEDKILYLPNGTQHSTPTCRYSDCDEMCDPTDHNDCSENPCSFCSDEPNTWSVVLSGFSACGSGLTVNGTYSLARTANCSWEGNNGGSAWLRLVITGLGTVGVRYILSSITGANGSNNGDLLYFKTVEEQPSNCCQSNVLSLAQASCTAPATVTITPVTCCAFVEGCFCDGLSQTLTLTIVSGCAGAATPVTITYNASGAYGAGWYSPEETVSAKVLQWYVPCTHNGTPGQIRIRQMVDGALGSSQDFVPVDCDPLDSGNCVLATVSPCSPATTIRITE